MGIKIVREPSETPNINNIDDFVPFRYAYGNQDGYVIGKGNELRVSKIDEKNILIASGRLVVQGVEVDIDANGVVANFDDVSQNGNIFVLVYAKVNLGTNQVDIEKIFDTVDYPVIEEGDDLTEKSNGIANIILAHVQLLNGHIVNVTKKVKAIEYTNNITVKNAENSKKVNNLEIKQDENGVLRIGDIIIPQKKLLWSGKVSISSNSFNEFKYIWGQTQLKKTTIIEVVVQDNDGGQKKIIKVPIDYDSHSKQYVGHTRIITYVEPNGPIGDAQITVSTIAIDINGGVIKGCEQTYNGNIATISSNDFYAKEIYEIIE